MLYTAVLVNPALQSYTPTDLNSYQEIKARVKPCITLWMYQTVLRVCCIHMCRGYTDYIAELEMKLEFWKAGKKK